MSHNTSTPTQALPLHLQLRPRKSRTRTGCLTCRFRHKKCDEQTLGSILEPTCATCLKKDLECLWPQGQTRESKSTLSRRTGVRISAGGSPSFATDITLSSTNSSREEVRATSYLRQSPIRDTPYPAVRLATLAPFCRPISSNGGILQAPEPRFLLEHYTLKTAGTLAARKTAENPYLTCVLPRALADELILQCILALSATHRAYDAANQDADRLYWTHYMMAARKLRSEWGANIGGGHSDRIRLLLAAILLATTEAVAGNSQSAANYHLRASQPLVSVLLASMSNNPLDQELISFLAETYAYLALVANITFTSGHASGLLMDPLLWSLEQNRPKGTSGSMMGCAHGLFELIPSICLLANARMQEIQHGMVSDGSFTQYSQLETRIRMWTVPGEFWGEAEWVEQLLTAACIYQHALLVFLHTAFHCSPVADDNVTSRVQPEIEAILPLSQRILSWEGPSPLVNTLLWPAMIVGSCLRHPDERQLLRTTLMGNPFSLAITDRAALLLDLLWNEPCELDKALFGPMGLQVIMDKYKVNLCMA